MTQQLYDTIWSYVARHKANAGDDEEAPMKMFQALVQEKIVGPTDDVNELREIYECINSALLYAN